MFGAIASEHVVSEQAIGYCNEALDHSHFFGLLQEGSMPDALMKYAFLQYGFFRDQLHRWFGLCIIKAGQGSDASQRDAVMALANHIFTDLRDGHDLMFAEFLRDLGLTEAELAASSPSPSTAAYIQSFFDDFGYEPSNFYEALAALSGRELSVAVRNGRILRGYFDPRNLARPTWIALHAELELEHFHDAVRPALRHCAGDSVAFAALTKAVTAGIERHAQYFDALLREYEAERASRDGE